MDLEYVKVYAIDQKENKVPTASGELTFEVIGEGKIIALDNGDHSSDDFFSGNKKTMYKGFAMAILRSSQKSGTVKLKIKGADLKQTTQSFITK